MVAIAILAFVVVFGAERAFRDTSSPDAAIERAAATTAGAELAPGRPPANDAVYSESSADRAPRTRAALPEALRSMQAASRESVFQVAVRDAGFQCHGLSSAREAALGAWRVSCSDARAYFVTADALGRLVVEPLSYSDGLGVSVIVERVEPPIPVQ